MNFLFNRNNANAPDGHDILNSRPNTSAKQSSGHFSSPIQRTTKSDKLSFRTSIGEKEGPTITIPVLHPDKTLPQKVPTWKRKFKLLYSTNNWTVEQGIHFITLSINPELHSLLDGTCRFNEKVEIFKSAFFPPKGFSFIPETKFPTPPDKFQFCKRVSESSVRTCTLRRSLRFYRK